MRCLKCFSEIGDLSVCSVCGFDKKEYLAQPHYMSEGSTLQNGRYKVGCSVGAGGFGITYAAWDDTLNIKVAIKEYLPGEFSTRIPGNTKVTVYGGEKETQFNDGLKKFLEEGKRLAQFRTVQGIVHIYDVFEENGTAYLVMEYLEGETLSEKIKRGEKLDEETVVNLLVEILDALEVVHEKGIIHRDIAPNNIFLCADGSAKLIDFGAARSATGTHSKSLTVLYKKGFTPLEQYQSRGEQGPWTDIYSLAATAYVALTGVVPVGAMERCAKDTLKSPRKAGAKIRSNVEKAIMNSLNLKWKKRTQSASDFRKELLSSKSVKYRFHRENEKKIGKIPMPFLVGSLVVLFSVGIFIGLIFTGVIDYESITPSEMFVESGKSRVINFVNMDEEKAMEKAEKLGFQMEVSYKYDEAYKDSIIIEQSEQKGTILDEGSIIHIVINKEPKEYTMMNLVNLKLEDGKKALEELNIQYEVVEHEYDSEPGIILAQSVEAGKSVSSYIETVTLEVSKDYGYDTSAEYEMVDLVGENIYKSRLMLRQICQYCNVSDLEDEIVYSQNFDNLEISGLVYFSSDLEDEIVYSQSVIPGETVYGGEVVELVVGPSLIDMDISTAEELLDFFNISYKTKEVQDEDKTNGTVTNQVISGENDELIVTLSYVNNQKKNDESKKMEEKKESANSNAGGRATLNYSTCCGNCGAYNGSSSIVNVTYSQVDAMAGTSDWSQIYMFLGANTVYYADGSCSLNDDAHYHKCTSCGSIFIVDGKLSFCTNGCSYPWSYFSY